MTDKYNYIEIWTAKNLLIIGYKWIARNESGRIFAYTEKPIKEDSIWNSTGGSLTVCEDVVPIFPNIDWEDSEPISLEDIVHPQILKESERKYLSAVIEPFRKDVHRICKSYSKGYERLVFYGDICFFLPDFEAGTMYKNMDDDKWYTPEELGL